MEKIRDISEQGVQASQRGREKEEYENKFFKIAQMTVL